MWVPPETKDPVLLHHPTREAVGYFGAVRLRDGKFIFQREDMVFNSETFFNFLKQLRKASCHSGRRAVYAQYIKAPCIIATLFLPTVSCHEPFFFLF